jgi:hypothetical protein
LTGFIRHRKANSPLDFHEIEDEVDIVYPIDLNRIEAKATSSSYPTLKSFLSDLRRFRHNLYIMSETEDSPVFDSMDLKAKKDRLEESETMISHFVSDTKYMAETCIDCVLNFYDLYPEDSVPQICRKPHPLVMIRQKSWPIWPAKALALHPKRDQVNVRFFGDDHKRSWIWFKNCQMLGEDMLDAKLAVSDDKFRQSMEGVVNYMEAFETRFGYKLRLEPEAREFKPQDMTVRLKHP